MELITNATQKIQQNPLQIHDSSYSGKITGKVQNPSYQMQQDLSEVFTNEQTQQKLNVQNYNIKKQSKMQINCYEKENWNKIACYNSQNNLTQSIKMILILRKKIQMIPSNHKSA